MKNLESGNKRKAGVLLRHARMSPEAAEYRPPTALIARNYKEVVRCALKQHADCLYIFVSNRLRLVVYHFVEVLVAHPKLFIQPVFCFSSLGQQIQDI